MSSRLIQAGSATRDSREDDVGLPKWKRCSWFPTTVSIDILLDMSLLRLTSATDCLPWINMWKINRLYRHNFLGFLCSPYFSVLLGSWYVAVFRSRRICLRQPQVHPMAPEWNFAEVVVLAEKILSKVGRGMAQLSWVLFWQKSGFWDGFGTVYHIGHEEVLHNRTWPYRSSHVLRILS